jgi:hypothetical protein
MAALLGIASVSALLLSRGPATVLRRVIPFIVDAVNGMRRRWLESHIGQEVVERVQPSTADADAAASVSVVTAGAWVVAPDFHVVPRPVFGRVVAAAMSVSKKVIAIGFGSTVAMEATATSRMSRPKSVRANLDCGPALTFADPFRVPSFPGRALSKFDHDEPTEGLPRQIEVLRFPWPHHH